MTITDADLILARAKEITKDHPQPLTATNRLRREFPLSVPQAKSYVMQALNERSGIYYVVAPGVPLISEPHTGLEAATTAARHLGAPFKPVLLADAAGPDPRVVTERLLHALPDPADEDLISRLLCLLIDHRPDLKDALDRRYDRQRLISTARSQLARAAAVTP